MARDVRLDMDGGRGPAKRLKERSNVTNEGHADEGRSGRKLPENELELRLSVARLRQFARSEGRFPERLLDRRLSTRNSVNLPRVEFGTGREP